ncbi:Transcriptional regulator, LacI family [hydrothermal vent metagenome]|uniref:Transcriptional regulator, LacI family n=1 Tax=hydrothermal vent metagenome TaxID=652676 RepID=A0A3B0U441_9ZZZZ
MNKINPRKKTMSIARLASHLGLSEGTVSRALNDYPDIAKKTRQRVREAASELGYRPSSTARRLARGVVETVGFVLPGRRNHLSDPFLSEILDGLAAELATNDWDLLLAAVPDGHDEIEVMDRLLRSGKIGAFAVTRVRRSDKRVEFLRGAGVPFVVHGRTEKCDDYAWLDIDNEKAFVDAVNFLLGLGHTNIAMLGGDLEMNFAWSRRQGFVKAMIAAGLEPAADKIIDNVTDGEAGLAAMARLLALPDRPTAVVCVTDNVAIGAINAIQRAGLKAGHDVSVVGYDGLPMGKATEPALTTMSQASYDAGRQVARMLLSQAAAGKNSQTTPIPQILWEAKLTLRASANPPVHLPANPSHREETNQ